MSSALYDANSQFIDEARRQRRVLDDLNKQINQCEQQLAVLSADIEKQRALGKARPTAEQISQLESQAAELEKAWNDSVAAVKDARRSWS